MAAVRKFAFRTRKRRLTVFVVAMLIAGGAIGAWAYWSAQASAGSNGASAGATVNQGATPTASVTTIGREVTVGWGASTLSNGVHVDGYLVKRYPSAGGAATISPIGTCAATVNGLTCVEDDVPTGSWKYTVTPVIGTNWQGIESAASGAVSIGQAALTVNGSPFGNAAFGGTPSTATTTGSLSGFSGYNGGEGVTYRLDAATALTGSPNHVGTNGDTTITALGIPKSAGDGSHTVDALGDAAYFPSQASTGIVIDTTAPSVTAQLTPAANASGWNNTSPVSVALVADDGTGSGVSQIKYTTDGSDPTTSGTAYVYASGSPFAISAQGTTTVKFYATDMAGNASAVQTQLVKIDTTPPTNGLSLTNVTGGLSPTAGPLGNNATVYYRGSAAGSFTIRNALADTLSGPASSGTAALAGNSSGWSHSSSVVTTPSGGPYVSASFSWTAGTSGSPSETVTGADVAANTALTTLNLVDDEVGPTVGSVDATGLVGTGSRYSTSTTLSIAFSKGADSGSGLAATGAKLLRAQANLTSNGISNGSCGSYGAFTQVGSTDPSSPFADNAANGISTGHCYQYQYVVSDNVGNTTTYTSGDINVDTTAPSSPTNASISTVSGSANQYISGSQLYYNPVQSGSFTVDSSTSDGESGIQGVSFPSVAGFTGGGTVTSPTSGTTFRSTYSWNANGGSASPGAQTISSTNNATGTASNNAAFTLTKDGTAPSGGSVDATGLGGTGFRYSTSTTLSIAFGKGTDSGSGLAATGAKLLRAQANLTSNGTTNGSCGSYGVFTQVGSTDPSSPFTDNAAGGISTGHCYQYQYVVSDNVGNTTTYTSGDIKVDTTAPNAGTITANGGNTYNKTGTVSVVATGASDAESGITTTTITRASGTLSNDTCGALSGSTPVTLSGGNDGASLATGCYQYTYSSINNAGASSSTQSGVVKVDLSPPTGGSITANGGALYNTSGSILISTNPFADAETGVASTAITRASGTLTNNTCGTISGSTVVTVSGGNDSASLTTGCYQYTFTGTDKAGNATSRQSTVVKVDTDAPTGSITAPSNGATISSDATTVSSNSADVGSGVASALFQYAPHGGSTWTPIASATGPFTVSWSTRVIANGSYDLRVITTDNAGNATTTGGITVTVANNYSFSIGPIATQRAGTAFGGFTIQLTENGSSSGSFNASSYAGAHAITFAGTATTASPNATAATGLSQSLTFNSSGLATVPANSITLYKAQSSATATLSASDAANSVSGSTSFSIDSAGVTLSFNPSSTVTFTKAQTKGFTVNVPNDAYGNVFTSAAGLTVTLSLSSTAHFTFTATGTGSQTLTITSGPLNNTFSVTENGNNQNNPVTLSGSVAAPFTSPASDTLNENG